MQLWLTNSKLIGGIGDIMKSLFVAAGLFGAVGLLTAAPASAQDMEVACAPAILCHIVGAPGQAAGDIVTGPGRAFTDIVTGPGRALEDIVTGPGRALENLVSPFGPAPDPE